MSVGAPPTAHLSEFKVSFVDRIDTGP